MHIKLKINKKFILFLFIFLSTLGVYVWFINSRYITSFRNWSSFHQKSLFIIVFCLKTLGVIWPPLHGGVFTLGSIPFLTWSRSYLTDLLGSVSGAIITYQLGKNFGYSFLTKILDSSMVEKIKALKINENIGILFVMTIIGETTFYGVVTYAAGLFKVNFLRFLFVVILSHVLLILPAFYLISTVFEGKHKLLSIFVLMIVIPLFYSFRRRFFR